MTTLVDILVDRSATAASQYVTLVSKADASVYQATAPSTDPTTLNPGQFSITPKPPAGAYNMYLGATQGAQTRLVDSEYVVDPFDDTGLATFPHGLTVSAGAVSVPARAIADGALSTNVDLLNATQTISGVKSFSAAAIFQAGFTVSAGQVGTFGTGDLNNLTGSLPTTGRSLAIYAGTAAAPDTTVLAPLLKISRFQKYLDADAFGTNSDPTASAIEIDVSVDVASERQGIGVYSVVETYSTTTPASGKSADAFPFFGIGISAAGSTHTGGGAYLEGRKLGTLGVAEALELHINNSSGSDEAFINNSFSKSAGIWLTSAGANLVAVGLSIGGQSPSQFDVGIGFTTYSGISAVKTASIYDHAQAATSILIDNTHATAAIAVAAGSNMVIVGGTTSVFGNANALIELQGNNNFIDGLLAMGSTTNLKTYTARIRNSSGQMSIGIVGVANDLITGSIAGDGVFRTSSANKFVHMGGTTSVIKVGNANTLGFFNVTAVAQESGSNDVLASLVTYGLRAASSNPPLNLGSGTLTAGTGAFSKDLKRSRQTPTEAVLVSGVDATAGEEVSVTLSAARVVGAPTNAATGQHLHFVLIQNGTGGWAVTWNAAFKVTWADTGNTLNKRSTIDFRYDGTNWNQVGAQSPYV